MNVFFPRKHRSITANILSWPVRKLVSQMEAPLPHIPSCCWTKATLCLDFPASWSPSAARPLTARWTGPGLRASVVTWISHSGCAVRDWAMTLHTSIYTPGPDFKSPGRMLCSVSSCSTASGRSDGFERAPRSLHLFHNLSQPPTPGGVSSLGTRGGSGHEKPPQTRKALLTKERTATMWGQEVTQGTSVSGCSLMSGMFERRVMEMIHWLKT